MVIQKPYDIPISDSSKPQKLGKKSQEKYTDKLQLILLSQGGNNLSQYYPLRIW